MTWMLMCADRNCCVLSLVALKLLYCLHSVCICLSAWEYSLARCWKCDLGSRTGDLHGLVNQEQRETADYCRGESQKAEDLDVITGRKG